MPRTNFTTSTPISTEFLNKVARPRISALDDDGAIPLITNSDMLATPGSLLYDFYDLADSLAVQSNPGGGLTVIVKGGVIRLPDNSNLTISQTTLTVPDNQVSFVWINRMGALSVSSVRPNYGEVLASVTTVSGTVTNITDLRVARYIQPQANVIDTFGGISQVDYIVPPSTTVNLSGVIECRNFVLPANSTIRIVDSLYVRASGNADILGTINTVPASSVTFPTTGGTYGGSNYSTVIVGEGAGNVFSTGIPIRARRRNVAYNGYLQFSFECWTTASNAATYLVPAPQNLPITDATNGASLTINAAGTLNVGVGAQINLRAVPSVKPLSIPGNLVTMSGHKSTGIWTGDWVWAMAIQSPQGSAGNAVLQSATSINISQNAVINCKGADEGWAIQAGATNAGATSFPGSLGNGWFKPGAGGGGGILLFAPVVTSHPSATYDVSAGSMGTPSATNLYGSGVGAVGNGCVMNASGTTLLSAAQAGQLITTIGYPTEF